MIHLLHRILRADKKPVVGFFFLQPLHQGLHGNIGFVQYNMGLPADVPGAAVNSQCGTNGIQIRDFVAHDKYGIGMLHQLPQRIGNHPGLHLCPFLHSLALSAVKEQLRTLFDNGLIPSASQSQVHSRQCTDAGLCRVFRIQSHTDAEGNRDPVAGLDPPHPVKDVESFLLQLFQCLRLHDHNKLLPVIFDPGGMNTNCPLCNAGFNLRKNRCSSGILRIGQDFVIIVHPDMGDHDPLCLIQCTDPVFLRDIQPIDQEDHLAFAAVISRLDRRPQNLIPFIVKEQIMMTFLPGVAKPGWRQFRYKVMNIALQQLFPLKQFPELGIVPGNVPSRLDDHQGNGDTQYRILGGPVNILRQSFQVTVPFYLAAAHNSPVITSQKQKDKKSHSADPVIKS